MAENFYPSFSEFLPVYRGVSRVWIGDGVSTGTTGVLYAEYADGTVSTLGSVTCYAAAVEAGYTGTERQWLSMLMSVSQLVSGTQISISYQSSNSGTTHPDASTGWSSNPSPVKGEYLWAKIEITWTSYSPTIVYIVSYQGKDGEKGEDGQVQSVNGEIGDVTLYGDTILISSTENQSIKDYIDQNMTLEFATDEDIDALFSMIFFSGAAFITGRTFNSHDSITYKIEAITQGAPMPESQTITVRPTGGNSCHFSFGHILYKTSDIPTGETQKTYEYRVIETANTMDGVTPSTTSIVCSVTLVDNGTGLVVVQKSENFNSLYFAYEYHSTGSIKFEGNLKLTGRSMSAGEFKIEIKEQGTTKEWTNISTSETVAHNIPATIEYPTIWYSLDDVGIHTYKVKQTSISGDGVTIDSTIHTIVVEVRDISPDGELEIITDGSELHVDFTNSYAATGSVTFEGSETLVNRLFRNDDSLSVTITGNGKLPSTATIDVPFVVGDSTVDFAFASIQYTLNDMSNISGGYDDTKTFVYNVTETASIAGTTGDGLAHTITVTVTDNKRGTLLINAVYSDGNEVSFTRTYDAFGTLTISGEKNLINRKFVATDSMHVVLMSTNSGKLPVDANKPIILLTGQNKTTFNFVEVNYTYADLKGAASYTYHYFITEDTVITGATNDTNIHSLDVYIADNYDGTLTVTPTYSDGNKFSFTSTYDATGYVALTGIKTIVNRTFKSGDLMSVAITSTNNGNLPSPASISVPLSAGGSTASFSFAQITYRIADLGGLASKTFNYTVTETTTMDGTTPLSLTDTVSVTVSDNSDGTLSAVPTYTNGNAISLTNVYSAFADLSFSARCVFTNGNMSTNAFTIKITQVTGNNSTTQAVENVVLAAPATMTASSGNTQDLDFSNIARFEKNSLKDDTVNTYWFLIEEVLPAVDAQGIYNNIKYDTSKKWINVSVSDNLNGTLNITKIPAPSTGLDMTFTNEQLASLTITKTWTGDYSALTTAEKNAFTFVVSGPNSYSESFTYANMSNDSYVLSGLKLGEYTVTETNNIVENFSITTSYNVGMTSTNVINLAVGGGTVNVANAVNKLEATLNIVKTWSGDHNLLTSSQKNNVTFTVTGPKQKSTDANTYSNVFTYSQMTNDRMTLEHLTLGTYTVTESNYTFTDFDTIVTYTENYVASNSVTLADNDNKTITVDNNYTHHTGSVTVTKEFSGASALPVNYNITNDYNASVFTVNNADSGDGTTTPYSWTISNVPVHTTIQFTENNSDITYYTHSASSVPADRTCAAVTNNTTSAVAFTNTYVHQTGTAKVTAQFTGITLAEMPSSFNITNNYNASTFTFANADNTATADGITIPYEWTIANVPTGNTVTFTVHDAGITDYEVVTSASPANFACTIGNGTTSTVAITNTYTYDTGYIRIYSSFPDDLEPNNYQIVNDYNNDVFTIDNAIEKTSGYGYRWEIRNVPVHTVVNFTASNYDINGYTYSGSTNKACVPIIKNTPSNVSFINNYTRDTGSVTVSASFSGVLTIPANYSITNDYDDSTFTYANADNTATADGINIPYEWTISGVPTGTQIEFTESNYDVQGYNLDVSSDTVITSSAATKDTTTTVSFANTYTEVI